MGGWLGLCSRTRDVYLHRQCKQDKLRNDLVSLEEEIKRLQGQQKVTINQLRLLNTQRQVQDSLVGLLQEDSLQLAFSLDSLQREEDKTHNEYERLKRGIVQMLFAWPTVIVYPKQGRCMCCRLLLLRMFSALSVYGKFISGVEL